MLPVAVIPARYVFLHNLQVTMNRTYWMFFILQQYRDIGQPWSQDHSYRQHHDHYYYKNSTQHHWTDKSSNYHPFSKHGHGRFKPYKPHNSSFSHWSRPTDDTPSSSTFVNISQMTFVVYIHMVFMLLFSFKKKYTFCSNEKYICLLRKSAYSNMIPS